MKRTSLLLAAAIVAAATQLQASMFITEWMYSGADGEFIEFTNVGGPAVDLTGWSYDDNSRTPGSVSLSAFGVVQPGESVILTEASEAGFRTAWNLPAAIKIIGANSNNLGRSDEINLYDAANALVDRLTYNDQGVGNVAGPRTSEVSGNPGSPAALGANNASLWVASSVGDAFGSYLGAQFSVANPGSYAIPEPATAAGGLLVLATLAFAGRGRQPFGSA